MMNENILKEALNKQLDMGKSAHCAVMQLIDDGVITVMEDMHMVNNIAKNLEALRKIKRNEDGTWTIDSDETMTEIIEFMFAGADWYDEHKLPVSASQARVLANVAAEKRLEEVK